MAKTAFVIDFDDTLVHTDAKVIVTHANGEKKELTPAEYVNYKKQSDDSFDYSQFETLINPRPIEKFVKLLKNVIQKKLASHIVVLSARGLSPPIAKFLKSIGITSGVKIVTLGDSDPAKKAGYINKLLDTGYNNVMFIDDADKNIAAVKDLQRKHPSATISVHQAGKGSAPSKQPGFTPAGAKRSSIQGLLNRKIKNPDTDREILIKSALRYDKKSPVYRAAVQFINRNR